MKQEFLNEQNYQNTNNKLRLAAFIIWGIALLISGSLFLSARFQHSDGNKAEQRQLLEAKRDALRNKGVRESSNYEAGESYDLYIIVNALDPSFNHCAFDEYKNNPITEEYCKSNSSATAFKYSIAVMMFGGVIGLALYMTSKQRNMLAYQVQSVMPVMQEGAEKMVPTATKIMKEMAPVMAEIEKERMKTVAPAYGDMAKEISRGIKEGLKDEESDK